MTHCSCNHCFNPIVAQGLCEMHYRRMKRHGNVEQTRPADWGQKKTHPLYNSWAWMNKMQGRHKVEEGWKDFWQYVKDIGERPTENHRLKKLDESLGYVKGNVVWSEIIPSQDKALYAKEWRKRNPAKAKNSDLKRSHGISYEEYLNLQQNQSYKCKICGIGDDQNNMSLVVDHCHTSGKIRGLLCSNCNRGIGMLQDNVDVLQKAIDYLKEN